MGILIDKLVISSERQFPLEYWSSFNIIWIWNNVEIMDVSNQSVHGIRNKTWLCNYSKNRHRYKTKWNGIYCVYITKKFINTKICMKNELRLVGFLVICKYVIMRCAWNTPQSFVFDTIRSRYCVSVFFFLIIFFSQKTLCVQTTQSFAFIIYASHTLFSVSTDFFLVLFWWYLYIVISILCA